MEILSTRLFNQAICETTFEAPVEVVRSLGAVQAQDYGAAKWALGLRLSGGATDADVEQAFTSGKLLRTHVMRPTWHFVLPADIRWLLALTSPRVNAGNAYMYRKLELDDTVFKRSNAVLVQALRGGKHLTRPELVVVLQQGGIVLDDLQRLTSILMHAELDGIICSGARRDKQFTYALLDERVPSARILDRDEALVELVLRYFTSHGPATLHDFVWWSGLTLADARNGVALLASQLQHEVIDKQTYWYVNSTVSSRQQAPTAYLLPNYDEYIVGYTDRSAMFQSVHSDKLDARGNVLFNHTIILDGRVVGTWKRTLKKAAVLIVLNFFVPLSTTEKAAVMLAAERYGAFLNLTVDVT